MVWRLLVWALIIYLAYRVLKNIIGFIVGPKDAGKPTHGRQEQKRHGETIINRSNDPSRKNSDDNDEGEYIDYKEIKD